MNKEKTYFLKSNKTPLITNKRKGSEMVIDFITTDSIIGHWKIDGIEIYCGKDEFKKIFTTKNPNPINMFDISKFTVNEKGKIKRHYTRIYNN